MDDKRNLVFAVLLTGLILFGWPYVASYFFPTPAPVTSTAKSAATPAGAATSDVSVEAAPAKLESLPLGTALQSSARVLVETPKLKGSINLEGAKIDDLLLLAHRTELAKDAAPVRLFAPSGTKDAYFARFGWAGTGIIAPDDKTVWTPSSNKLTPLTPVTLSWTNPQNQKFEIALSIDENYMITAKQRFTNGGNAPVQIANFALLSRTGKPADSTAGGSIFTHIHIGPMGVFDNKPNYDWGYVDVAENKGEASFNSTGGWLGFTDKYWLGALIPDQKTAVSAKFRASGDVYQAQVIPTRYTNVAAGAALETNSRLFAGAKEMAVLDSYSKKLGIPYLDYAIDWGWFWFIAIPFFWILHWLFGVFGNFGVAIIGLTLVVRGFMYPVAQKQFASMAQMRAVQPKLKALQERWKDDKPRLQQEMMKLYKEEKVNPLAGCLPVVLQIPIFFALYKILLLSIEMRHQPFVLWLKDLSAPDPLTPINLFGLLPFDPPSFIAIGVLPILLGVTMWLMQRLNPQPMDEVQKQVFAVMPWFLMFIMAPFAAGLQLYWVMSNVVSIAQQKWLYSRHPVLREQMARDAEEKAKAKANAKA
ncbi:YidC Preprotein translocase subunit YidC [Sphingomonadaceae bacterium]|uniref:membrane protein insertase YidC n=2 Tax=Sphingorhabdus sp. TaxID=1902408 RepID=UPI0037C57579|nr:membrane protein insertase YidC [Sphingomonadaceae bacterium]MCF8498106.1 membrane protein insertase YidC [Sphingomonadaceae bacterium]